MMGLGFLGSSSSSSSSNLSPLAPPFTVDRSNHNKPIFNDPSSYWPYSHPPTARQDFLPDSLSTAAASSNDCMYIIPDPPTTHNVKPATRWSAVNSSPKPATDSFSYNLSEAKPFYPPYANNDDIPLVTLSKPGYDLLSTSGLVLGDESSQVDYTRSLSGLEYNPQRDGVWGGTSDGKHGKKMESVDSFFSQEANIAASLAYNDYLHQGGYGAETLSKGKEDTSMFYHADIIRRKNNIGLSINGKLDGASFSSNNHRLNPEEFSKGGPAFRAFPMFSETHPLVPSPEPPEEPWNSQNSYTLYDKRFHLFDCSGDRMSPSMTKSSSLVIKPPAAALNVNDVVGSHKCSKEPQGLESKGSFVAPNQLSFQIGRSDDHTFVAPSSTKEDTSASGRLNFEFKARSSLQVPDINIPNVKTTAASSFEHFDHHNPAEDSPCWKGAPTSHFLPFGSPEATSPQHPTKKLQTGNGVNLQGSQTDHSFIHSSKVHDMSEKEHTSVAVGVEFKPRNTHGFFNESTSDANSQTSQPKLPNLEEDVMSPKMKTQLLHGEVGPVEYVSVSSVEDVANPATAKKVNTSVLVKALHNLSDMLLLHCQNDEYAPKEQDREALHHVIVNLNVCMSRKVQVDSTNKSMLPLQSTSNASQEVTNDTTGIFHDEAGQECAHYQKLNSEIVVESVVCPPKDDNMVQAIKKVLDENLECKEELPSQTLLYKNLWLEAEAELCSLSYRARFERMKREAEKGVSDASESTKKVDLKIPPKLIDKAVGSEISNTHVQKTHHLSGIDDLVMARFNILKQRGELNPVNVEGNEVSGNGSEGSGVALQQHLCKGDAGVIGEKVEPLVMARLNILKCRGEPNAVDVEESGEREANKDEAVANESGWYSGNGSDWEHILKDEFSWQCNGRLS